LSLNLNRVASAALGIGCVAKAYRVGAVRQPLTARCGGGASVICIMRVLPKQQPARE
jgi:hypothetical protein